MTNATMPNYEAELAAIRDALAAHYATVLPSKDQMISLPVKRLLPCCDGVFPDAACQCQRYDPSASYP